MTLQTEYPFTLPRGYADAEGNLHREGVMRLATAYDEIAPMKDPRVQANPGYLVIVLLARVVTRLGDLDAVNPKVIENLFAADLAWLQEFYEHVNETGRDSVELSCPHCGGSFDLDMSGAAAA